MLTVRYERLGLKAGDRVLDLGAGFGRHAFDAARHGARVVALDYAHDELVSVRNTFAAMAEAGEVPADRYVGVLRGDAKACGTIISKVVVKCPGRITFKIVLKNYLGE